MAGRQGEDGFALAEALGEALGGLDTGPEPPMPDLVSRAIVQGTRIRRRRRIGAALGSAAMAAVVMAGGYGILAPKPEPRHSLPAAEPTVWYPSLKLLRSIVPPTVGTVESAQPQPQQSRRPATYYRLTDPKSGLVSDLYVSVARAATGPSLRPPGPVECRDGHGPEPTTTWGGLPFKCSVTRTKSGDRVLIYNVDKRSLPAHMDDSSGLYAHGTTYVTTDGWEVQVIMSSRDDWSVLIDLATDSRILDAVEKTGS